MSQFYYLRQELPRANGNPMFECVSQAAFGNTKGPQSRFKANKATGLIGDSHLALRGCYILATNNTNLNSSFIRGF